MAERRSGEERRAAVLSAEPRTTNRSDIPEALSRRVVVEAVRPAVDGGRFAAKRTLGESVDVSATIFADGHDVIAAVVRDRPESHAEWRETEMVLADSGLDEWRASFSTSTIGWHEFVVGAWVDRFRSWRRDLAIKNDAGQDVGVELLEGAMLLRDAAARADREGSPDADELLARADALTEERRAADRVTAALDQALASLMTQHADRSQATWTGPLRLWVDRERARFSAWYEMFPRSSGNDPQSGGSFSDAALRLPAIADLGFDVVYLPPIHPIGRSFRKGPNNSLAAAPGDPGSPWAIGSEEGGHTSVHPSLGSLADFEEFRATAHRLGMEIALDLAWQCSPDHPWVREHPEWFRHRPDGTIKYAENPPKKYQDIYPLDFACEDWRGLWRELLAVTLFWVERGVRIFRVDNPHTKTFGFWEWLIDAVHARFPDVLFLAEAFTRPSPMQYLAKAGFTQSYTYFTWRNTKAELTEYFSELTGTDLREYLRPNLFANTPDILHAYLQEGGRPAFEARLLLAATLGASYGIYSGFEVCENVPVRPGSEEYLDSEKFQVRHRDWAQTGGIADLIARVNQIRRRHPALQSDWTLQFHETDNPELIAYSKRAPDGSDLVLVVVNLDPHHMQHGWVRVPLDLLAAAEGVPAPAGSAAEWTFSACDLIDDTNYTWRGEWNYVRFDPGVRQGHLLQLRMQEA